MATKCLMSFEGKRVLVTGGGKGLGLAIVKKFVDAGASVFALDKDANLLNEVKTEFPNVNTICVDLLDCEETRKAVEAVAPIDHLVNNAAIIIPDHFIQIKPETVDLCCGVNLKSVIVVSQAVVKGIIEKGTGGGTVVNVSSLADTITSKGFSLYCCTKAALTMLTKSMALELGEYNIRVNCIRPAVMVTDMFNLIPADILEHSSGILSRGAFQRPVKLSEAADLVMYLSSTFSTMITGESVAIDGGISCS